MSLISRITSLVQAIGADIKDIKNNYIRMRNKPASNYAVAFEVASYVSNLSNATGAIVIRMSSTAAVFNSLTFGGYKYASGGRSAISFVLSGYFYNTTKTWLNQALTHYGKDFPQVRTGYEISTGLPVIIIGDVGTVWPYPGLSVMRGMGTYTGATSSFYDGWTTALMTDLSGFGNITTPPESVPDYLGMTMWSTSSMPVADSTNLNKVILLRNPVTLVYRMARSDGAQWVDMETGQPPDFKGTLNRELADPIIHHDFVRSGKSPNNLVFSRASEGSYVDGQGTMRFAPADRPRIDHDPATGYCRGLLIESAATNILLYSEQDPSWSAAGDTPPTVDSTGMTYDNVMCTKTTFPAIADGGYYNSRAMSGSTTITANTKYVWSAWICLSRDLVAGESMMIYCTGAYALSGYNLVGPTTGLTKWTRITAPEPVTPTVGGVAYFTIFSVALNTPVTMYTSRRQIEAGVRSSSYIRTSGAAATRARDIARFPLPTGRGNKSWTVFSESMADVNQKPLAGNDQVVWAMGVASDATKYGRMVQHYGSTGYPIFFGFSGTTLHTSRSNSLVAPANSIARYAIRFNETSYKLSAGGYSITPDSALGVVTQELDTLYVGATVSGLEINGWVRKITLWGDALEDANLASLTS